MSTMSMMNPETEEDKSEAPSEVEVTAETRHGETEDKGAESSLSSKGVLSKLSDECQKRLEMQQEGENVSPWIELEPPTEKQVEEMEEKEEERLQRMALSDDENVKPRVGTHGGILGNWNGHPVMGGFEIRDLTEETQESIPSVKSHKVYRTAKYNVHFRIRDVKKDTPESEISFVGMADEKGEFEFTIPEESNAAGKLNVVAEKKPMIGGGETRIGSYSSDGSLEVDGSLVIEVEGEIEAGNTVTLKVVDSEGHTVPGADIFAETPVTYEVGEVFVREE